MWKLSGINELNRTEFEQIFSNYVELREKEKELYARGMSTMVETMTEDEVRDHSEKLLAKFAELHGHKEGMN